MHNNDSVCGGSISDNYFHQCVSVSTKSDDSFHSIADPLNSPLHNRQKKKKIALIKYNDII